MAILNEGIPVCTIAVREGIGLFSLTVHYISRRSPLRTDTSEGSNVIWNATIQGCRGYVNRTDVWVDSLAYEGSPRSFGRLARQAHVFSDTEGIECRASECWALIFSKHPSVSNGTAPGGAEGLQRASTISFTSSLWHWRFQASPLLYRYESSPPRECSCNPSCSYAG